MSVLLVLLVMFLVVLLVLLFVTLPNFIFAAAVAAF